MMFVPMLLMVEASSLVCGDKAITKVANMFFYYLFPSVAASVLMYMTCLFSSVCAGRSRSSSLEVKKRKATPKKEKQKSKGATGQLVDVVVAKSHTRFVRACMFAKASRHMLGSGMSQKALQGESEPGISFVFGFGFDDDELTPEMSALEAKSSCAQKAIRHSLQALPHFSSQLNPKP